MSIANQSDLVTGPPGAFARYMPGVTLVAMVAAAAYGLRQVPGLNSFSPMITSIFIGMLFANFLDVPANASAGIKLMGKSVLRLAVALLGFQLTMGQVLEVGASGMAALALIVCSTYFFALAGARLLGVDMSLARLIGAGTAICGASAVAAADSIENGPEENVAYAIGCVTLFGTVSMVIYPILGAALGLDANSFGFWTGSSIHEVAQVVATGFQFGSEAGETSVVVKLSRVLLLAPLLIGMAAISNRYSASHSGSLTATQILPVFVLCFILAMLASSSGLVPETFKTTLAQITPILLTASLGALGLGTSFRSIRMRGTRPLLLAGLTTVFIASAGLLAANMLA